ncbi:MAG: hypothetical protein IJP92_02765 [Lachnospiraceae bacterium]|nr:hypothetical protein [Lachnospiraceae bacterium]
MSQIMGLPADDLLKPTVKDLTVWEKGRWAGYKEAICDVMRIVDDADKKAADKTYIVLDDGSFYSQAKYIKEKMLESIFADGA